MKRGPKTKYNPERVKRICDAIESGQTQEVACHLAAVDSATHLRWLERHAEYAVAIAQAKQAHEAKLIEVWQHAATKSTFIATPKGEQEIAPDWRAAQALLKVRNRAVYSESAQVELTAGSGLSIHLHLGDEVV